MFRVFFVTVITVLLYLPCEAAIRAGYPFTIAHRGCWLSPEAQFTNSKTFVVNENSLEAVRMAARYGYKAIELDPKVTSDGVIVVMHDRSINRTMICRDGSEISQTVNVKDCTFEELRTKYVLRSSVPENRSQIPTLRELIEECARCGIMPLVHCNFYDAYAIVKEIIGDNFIAFGNKYSVLCKVRKISSCKILLDPSKELKKRGLKETPENVISLLNGIGGAVGISSMKYDMCCAEMCKALITAGYDVQSSIFPSPHELDAVRNGVTMLLSDFAWCPGNDMKPFESRNLKTSSEISWKGERAEYGAFTVEVEGKGKWEVDISGERTYVINRETAGKETISLRYYNREPTFYLKVLSGKGAKVRINNYIF